MENLKNHYLLTIVKKKNWYIDWDVELDNKFIF